MKKQWWGELCAEDSYLYVHSSPDSTIILTSFKLLCLLENKLIFINHYLPGIVLGILYGLILFSQPVPQFLDLYISKLACGMKEEA